MYFMSPWIKAFAKCANLIKTFAFKIFLKIDYALTDVHLTCLN